LSLLTWARRAKFHSRACRYGCTISINDFLFFGWKTISINDNLRI